MPNKTEKKVLTLTDVTAMLNKMAASAAEAAEAKNFPQVETVATVATPASQPGVADPQVAPASTRSGSGTVENPAPGLKTDPQGAPAPVAVAQKPAEKGELDKEASVSKLAQEIVGSIASYNSQKEAAAATQPSHIAATQRKEAATSKGMNIQLTTEVLSKIACIMLASEDGAAFVQTKLAEHLGDVAAQDVEAFLGNQADLMQKQAEADLAWAEYQEGVRQAEELIKYAQEQGIPIEALLAGQDGAEMDQAMAPSPEAVATGAEGTDQDLPEGDEQLSLENVIEALQELVAEGAITPEIAAELVSQIAEETEGMDGVEPEGGETVPELEAPTAAHEATETLKEEQKEEAAKAESEKEASHRLALALDHFSQYVRRA